MMYAIARELGAALAVQGVPFPVVFGPDPTESVTPARERIVLEQPTGQKRDVTQRPLHANTQMPWIRQQAATLRIFARSSLLGAVWHDHTERAERVFDHVQVELDALVRARKNTLTWGASGFVPLVDAEGSSVWSGAVYEADLTIDRGVFRLTWAGEGPEEVIIGTDVTIVNTIKVSQALGPAGTPPGDAETASGG
jgi:hypothetical protein